MSSIIVATDFSQIGEHAAHYACRFAETQKARIIIIHSFMIPVMFTDIPMPTSLVNDAQTDAETQMSKLLKELALAYPAVEIKGKVIYGDVIDAINEYVQDNGKPWMVVVGNSIAAETASWPDSTLIDAFKKLEYPVLAIPPAAAYRQVRNICFAFDNKPDKNDAALAQLKEIATSLNAALHVLSVQTGSQQAQSEIDATAKDLLSGADPQYHIKTAVENVDETIGDFVANNSIDWLIMIPRKHSFFEGLFHKSHTKNVAQHIAIPILALHENKKASA